MKLVWDAEAEDEPEEGCWITPDIYHGKEGSEVEGQVAVRFVCQSHGTEGGWAYGPKEKGLAVIEQARALQPVCKV